METFRLWPGHENNRLEVTGLDKKLSQLVLMIHEARRPFEVELPRWARPGVGDRVLGRTRSAGSSSAGPAIRKRHFLCGMDEQHLFIAQLPERVSTVRSAHEALKIPRVTSAERTSPARTIRQGEWFFVALRPDEERDLAAELGRGDSVVRRVGIAQAAGLRRAGRPHVADEVFVSRARRDEDRQPLTYVRGGVRHPDHRTVVLSTWRRVVPNREAFEAPEGVLWVD